MSQISSQVFYKEIEENKIFPLYFLYGDEPYLIQQSLLRIKEKTITETTKDFNFIQYYASDAEVETVRDEVDTLPMMAQRRVVFLKEAQELSDKEWEVLSPLITNIVDTTCFVITASKIDKRKKYIKELFQSAHCVEFKKPYDNQVPSWISYIAKSLELEISKGAILQLNKLVGNNLFEIHSELEKLREFVGGNRPIELADVLQVVSQGKEESVFDFTKAIARNDPMRALELLMHLVNQGQNEIGIVSLLARHLRILLSIIRGHAEGLSGAKLAHFSKVPPFFLEEYVEQSYEWTESKIHKTLVALSDTDKALKSSNVSSSIWLQKLIFTLAR